MIRKSASLLALLLLAGCAHPSQDVAPITAIKYAVPSSCNQPKVIAAFDAQVAGSKYVPTDWQPSIGTDLYDVINAKGIACTYGIQTAEIGGTVMWANDLNGLWESKKTQWLKDGQVQIDLAGIDETDATILKEGATGADEMHVWGVNLLYKGVWIQVNASFLQNVEEALPIIQSTIDSLTGN
ncbi:MAG: hypothetical protein WCJ89_03025 [Actinomycetes bacterium]